MLIFTVHILFLPFYLHCLTFTVNIQLFDSHTPLITFPVYPIIKTPRLFGTEEYSEWIQISKEQKTKQNKYDRISRSHMSFIQIKSSWKFRNIHRETLLLGSLFNKAACFHTFLKNTSSGCFSYEWILNCFWYDVVIFATVKVSWLKNEIWISWFFLDSPFPSKSSAFSFKNGFYCFY